MKRINPFRPGQIVTTGMFCGRLEEVETLERVLVQTRAGNPLHFAIRGERGIGKSSLLFYFQHIAIGEIDTPEYGKFNFLWIGLDLEPNATYHQIITRVGAELRRRLEARAKGKTAFKKGWEFLSRWEVMGVKYNAERQDASPSELLDELVDTVDRVADNLEGEIDGIAIAIDEADKPESTANLGEFGKLFTERLNKRGRNNVVLGLAGLPNLVEKLRKSHESSPRVFHDIMLEPLEDEERKEAVQRGLKSANHMNSQGTEIDAEALQYLCNLSEGYPHFIQQFAYCAFEADSDGVIKVPDVMRGSFEQNGALHQLGVKYFNELYFDQIGSDDYRLVLQTMADRGIKWISKKELRELTGLKDSTLTNALSALKRRHIILPRTGVQGEYRLPTQSFAVWIRVFNQQTEMAEGKQGNSK